MGLISNNDQFLLGITHLIIDEIHERDVNANFLLRTLKKKLPETNLKLILMSATLHSEIFSNYFDDCFAINISGRAYPVEEMYLDEIKEAISATSGDMETHSYDMQSSDNDYMHSLPLIVSLVKKLHLEKPKDEGILIFQAGVHPIELLKSKIQERIKTEDYRLFIVHSQISHGQTSAVFNRLESSMRKIVLATNIAETSITIEDMV